ncbi:NADH-quinone oxidoreductase subunit H [Aminithiophilus ramosus]|uniref:NADH-quinone oxidoreductase subunit H n=1 Tax=Aminithiophilus ramosus TaxID=3029084 RepID=A0A9Q7A4U5_9BACT|nr:NADH-quinone oxidoreductase subunit H [Aminithiophilus ramosus]QTX31321.1 NADH-quinone oxidoreductase subunit H [Aminithiophilus ramosus]
MLTWGTKILAAAALMLLASLVSLIFEGLGRTFTARLERRLGPPPSQPFYDLVKLFGKKAVLPREGLPWLFLGAPAVGAASALTIFLYLPIGSLPPLLSGGGTCSSSSSCFSWPLWRRSSPSRAERLLEEGSRSAGS